MLRKVLGVLEKEGEQLSHAALLDGIPSSNRRDTEELVELAALLAPLLSAAQKRRRILKLDPY